MSNKDRYQPKGWKNKTETKDFSSDHSRYDSRPTTAEITKNTKADPRKHFPEFRFGAMRGLLLMFYLAFNVLLFMILAGYYGLAENFNDGTVSPNIAIGLIFYVVMLIITFFLLFTRFRSGEKESRYPDSPLWLSKKVFQFTLLEKLKITLYILAFLPLLFAMTNNSAFFRLPVYAWMEFYVIFLVVIFFSGLNLELGLRKFLFRKGFHCENISPSLFFRKSKIVQEKREKMKKTMIFNAAVLMSRNGVPFKKPFYRNESLSLGSIIENMKEKNSAQKGLISFCLWDLLLEITLWLAAFSLLTQFCRFLRLAFL